MIGTNHFGQVTEEELRAIPSIAEWQVNGKLDSENLAFYNCVTLPLLEHVGIFRPLYSKIGRPSTNPAILTSALIYGKMKSLGDRSLVDEVLSSDATQIALGVYKSPYTPFNRQRLYEFRNKLADYKNSTGIDLLEQATLIVTNKFATAMGITGNLGRMDSTLIEANIRVRSRIDLIYTSIYDTCRVMFQTVSAEFVKMHNLEEFRKYTERDYRNQFLYRKAEDSLDKLPELFDAYKRLREVNFLTDRYLRKEVSTFRTMEKVFFQQTTIDSLTGERRLYVAEDHAMHSGILQSTYDLDCAYRDKDGNIVRGYVANTLESVGINGTLVTHWALAPANVADSVLFERYLNSLADVPSLEHSNYKKIVIDAAYYSGKLAKLANKKGILLFPSDLTGTDVDPVWAQFELNDYGTEVIKCPKGNTILDCGELNKQGRMTVHMEPSGCENCPNKAACKVKGKYVASVSVSPKTVYRAKIQEALGTEAYQPYQHLRNGVETIQNLLKNVYGFTRMRFKSLVKNELDLSCAVAALNFRKYLGFLNDTGRYAENELLG